MDFADPGLPPSNLPPERVPPSFPARSTFLRIPKSVGPAVFHLPLGPSHLPCPLTRRPRRQKWVLLLLPQPFLQLDPGLMPFYRGVDISVVTRR